MATAVEPFMFRDFARMRDRIIACPSAEAAGLLGCSGAARRPFDDTTFGPEAMELVLQHPGVVYQRPMGDNAAPWVEMESL